MSEMQTPTNAADELESLDDISSVPAVAAQAPPLIWPGSEQYDAVRHAWNLRGLPSWQYNCSRMNRR